MHPKKRRRGATLGLVAVVTIVLVVLGLGIFFLIKILGGQRELQNAVDSGVLNVAKQSLRTPTVNLFGASGPYDLSGQALDIARQNFSELRDPTTGEVSLIVYNRLVGQAMLVAMNAASDNLPGKPSPDGIANAKSLLNVLTNPDDGIGTLLSKKLMVDSAMDQSFTKLAGMQSMRMLNSGRSVDAAAAEKNVAYMTRETATNLQVASASIPMEFSLGLAPGFLGNATVKKNSKTYLKGYSLLGIPSITDGANLQLMGVALRPVEKPHLVSYSDFLNQAASPLPSGVGSRVPPNAFKTGGNTLEAKSGATAQSVACAQTSSINDQGEYTASIPCGYLVIANGNGSTPTGKTEGTVTTDGDAVGLEDNAYAGSGRDIFSDVLMNQQVFVTQNGAIASSLGAITAIQKWKQQQQAQGLPDTPVPSNLADALDGPSPKQTYADGISATETAAACDNFNSAPGPSANSACMNNLSSMASVYGSSLPDSGSGSKLLGLMTIEKEKAQVINPRPSGGPAVVTGVNKCTGLKVYPLDGITAADPIQFGKPATLGDLMKAFRQYAPTSNSGGAIYNQFITKVRQIRPQSTQADIDALMANPLPMGSVRYVWMDSKGALQFTDSASLPSWIKPSKVLPDGTTTVADTGLRDPNRVFVNLFNEQGFPSPWDAPGASTVQDKEIWTRSSGFNCLQGVLRFMNCATDEGKPWHAPC